MNKTLIGVVVGIAIGTLGYWAFTSGALSGVMPILGERVDTKSEDSAMKKTPDGTFCATIITPARDPETGSIKEFPTSCSVPEGWEVIENEVPELDLEVQ